MGPGGRRAAGISVAALVCGLSLSGCGGDGEGTDSDTSVGTGGVVGLGYFLASGNAACEKSNAMLLKAIRQVDPSDTAAVETVVRDELVPNIQGRVDALRTLGYPEGDMKTLDAIYAQSEIALARLTEDPGLFFSADPFADVDSALTDYGLDSCGA